MPFHRSPALLSTTLAALAVAACSRSPGEQVADVRSQHLDHLQAVCSAITGAVLDDAPVSGAEGVPDLPHLSMGAGGNAALLTQGDAYQLLVERHQPGLRKPRFADGPEVNTDDERFSLCRWAFTGRAPYITSRASAEAAIADLDKVQYVIALRTASYQEPRVESGLLVPGHAVFEARVLDVQGHLRGWFRFEATNSAKVDYTQKEDQQGTVVDDDEDRAIANDLWQNTQAAFKQAVAHHLPGADLVGAR